MENNEPKANKIIAGEIKYEFDISDSDYGFTFNDTPNNTLGALEIAHRVCVEVKKNLTNNIKSLKGKDKKLAQDRLIRVTHSEYMLKLLVESFMNDLLTAADVLQKENEIKVELKEVEQSAISESEN